MRLLGMLLDPGSVPPATSRLSPLPPEPYDRVPDSSTQFVPTTPPLHPGFTSREQQANLVFSSAPINDVVTMETANGICVLLNVEKIVNECTHLTEGRETLAYKVLEALYLICYLRKVLKKHRIRARAH